jgi:hypothetical protein
LGGSEIVSFEALASKLLSFFSKKHY